MKRTKPNKNSSALDKHGSRRTKRLYLTPRIAALLVILIFIGASTSVLGVQHFYKRIHKPASTPISTTPKPTINQPPKSIPTPTTVQETQKTNTPTTRTNVSPQKTAASESDRCLEIRVYFMNWDLNNFSRDIESLRSNLASVDRAAAFRTTEENNALKNNYVKFYNDSRSRSVAAFKQSMIDNRCPNYITPEPNPGYVDYY